MNLEIEMHHKCVQDMVSINLVKKHLKVQVKYSYRVNNIYKDADRY